jgi:hypothetical protein
MGIRGFSRFRTRAVRVDLVNAAAGERGELLNDRAVDGNP